MYRLQSRCANVDYPVLQPNLPTYHYRKLSVNGTSPNFDLLWICCITGCITNRPSDGWTQHYSDSSRFQRLPHFPLSQRSANFVCEGHIRFLNVKIFSVISNNSGTRSYDYKIHINYTIEYLQGSISCVTV